jgi:hypothetical protein
MSLLAKLALSLTDGGVNPDLVMRRGIRHLVRQSFGGFH